MTSAVGRVEATKKSGALELAEAAGLLIGLSGAKNKGGAEVLPSCLAEVDDTENWFEIVTLGLLLTIPLLCTARDMPRPPDLVV